MARTAPVPNMVAIPGMNPGLFVLGGGGDDGGGDGSGGDGKGGKQGAGGKNGGKDAQGGGKGACGVSPGKNGGTCPNHHQGGASGGAARGDPVDVVTGHVFTLPVRDVALPGPLPLTIERTYRSSLDRDVGLGVGWAHSLAWEIETRRRSVRVFTDRGTEERCEGIAEGESALGPDGWVLHRRSSGFALDLGDGRTLVFTERAENRYLLSAIRDTAGNAIRLVYSNGALVEVHDSVGRVVQVRRGADGRIASFAVKNAPERGQWVPFATFLYSPDGDLIRATDADGHDTEFAYDDHRLVRQTLPTGLAFEYRYDPLGRCVETWGARRDGADPSLAPDLPAVLADGVTPAKGILHVALTFGEDGYVEVADSVTVQRYFGNRHGKVDKAVVSGGVWSRTYDDHGQLRSFTDPAGATTAWDRDGRGRVVRVTDALGRVTQIERAPDGHIRRVTDAGGGVTEVDRIANGIRWTDPIGALFEVRLDERGLLRERVAPNGVWIRYRHDDHGNVVEAADSTGRTTRFSYDHFGRCVGLVRPDGATAHFAYSNRGDLVSVRAPDGGVTRHTYDGAGARTSTTDPSGATTVFVRGGLSKLCEVHEPNGAVTRYRYDREGRLVGATNPNGDSCSRKLDAAGLPIEERTFDGRTLRYEYDAAGRILAVESASGERAEYEHDAAGQLVAQRYSDGTEETFEYDDRGYLIAAHGPTGTFLFERNALGWITKETQIVGGEAVSVQTAYDLLGNPVARSTSLGCSERWTRNLRGHSEKLLIDGQLEVRIGRDAVGRELLRALPSGVRVESAYDAVGRLAGRRVLGKASRSARPGEPDWIGEGAQPLVERHYRYSARGDLSEVLDQALGARRFEYDPVGQVLSSLAEAAGAGKAGEEHFAYDPAGNLHDRGAGAPTREYAPGGRLARRGGDDFRWDEEARLAEVQRRRPDGQVDSSRFEWTDSGLLAAVELPDGRRVENRYDPFARRVEKRVLARAPTGKLEEVERTRFLWSSDRMVHEMRRRAAKEGDPIVEERAYVYDDSLEAPWAHREIRTENGERRFGQLFFYLNDGLGTPERLIGLDGSVACEMKRSTWGKPEAPMGARAETPFGFPGQYYDGETGLYYNRYRFYDPEAGRYLSADPVGLLAGTNAFAYAENRPTKLVDPKGLMAFVTVTGRPEREDPNHPNDPDNMETPPDIHGYSNQARPNNQAPVRDPAIEEAQRNADRHFGDQQGQFPRPARSGNCAEIDALHQQAADIRGNLSRTTPGWADMTDAERNSRVRNQLREEYRNGARISAFEGTGPNNRGENPIPPCPYCAQVMRELGIHPANINADPNRPANDQPAPTATGGVFVGNDAWDGTTHYGGGAQASYNSGSPERASTTNVVPALRRDGTQDTVPRPNTHLREGVFVPPEPGAAADRPDPNQPPPGADENWRPRGYGPNWEWVGY